MIATGIQYSVRDFVNAAAGELGMEIRWDGQGPDEKGYWMNRPTGNPDHPIIAVSPRYFRPTEVETLLGDSSKARDKLGWVPRTSFDALVAEMTREDLKTARQQTA